MVDETAIPENIIRWKGPAGADLTAVHDVRPDGNVTGGVSTGVGIHIRWQNGPIVDGEQNGALIEDVLELVLNRANRFNSGPLRNRYTSLTATDIESALGWQARRTLDRRRREVEGTYDE